MILPGSYVISLILLIVGMVCWGSWANTFKLTGPKWRFELYYLDFAAGVFIAALVAALTFGNLGWDGFSFLDDFRNAGKRQDLFAFLAGCVFNLGNMLLLGAISIAGMSVAFPIGMGFALVVGVVWSLFLNPGGSPLLLGLGCFAIVAAIGITAFAYNARLAILRARQPVEAKPATGKARPPKKFNSLKGIAVSLAGGLLLGSFFPLIEMARSQENGLGPYSATVVFAMGVVFSTFVYDLFLMNLPLEGKPVEMAAYLRGTGKQHLLGLFGGAIWGVGTLVSLVAAKAEAAAQAGPAAAYATSQGGTLLAMFWGLFVWKEFAGADGRVKSFLGVVIFLFALGLGAVSVAPLFPAH